MASKPAGASAMDADAYLEHAADAQVTSVPAAGRESSGVQSTRRTEAASRSATPPASEREILESSPPAPGARERSSLAPAIRAPRPRRSSPRRDTPRWPPRAAVAASPCESQLHRTPDTVQRGSWSGPAARVDDVGGRSRPRGSPRVSEPSGRHRPRSEIAFEARATAGKVEQLAVLEEDQATRADGLRAQLTDRILGGHGRTGRGERPNHLHARYEERAQDSRLRPPRLPPQYPHRPTSGRPWPGRSGQLVAATTPCRPDPRGSGLPIVGHAPTRERPVIETRPVRRRAEAVPETDSRPWAAPGIGPHPASRSGDRAARRDARSGCLSKGPARTDASSYGCGLSSPFGGAGHALSIGSRAVERSASSSSLCIGPHTSHMAGLLLSGEVVS